jgi:hypothetical protein
MQFEPPAHDKSETLIIPHQGTPKVTPGTMRPKPSFMTFCQKKCKKGVKATGQKICRLQTKSVCNSRFLGNMHNETKESSISRLNTKT